MKVQGALEVAQLEWFLNASKPAATGANTYRVIYVTDLKQVQISDGANWQAMAGVGADNTFTGTEIFSGTNKTTGVFALGATIESGSFGAISDYANATPVTEFSGSITSISGFSNPATSSVLMIVNRTGVAFTLINEDTGTTAAHRILTGTGSALSIPSNGSVILLYCGDSRWHVVGGSGSASASGPTNYFTQSNPTFETNSISPWTAFTTTLSAGVPTTITTTATQMAFAVTSTNPLAGTYSGQLTKSASNAVGQGIISGPMTINREDLAKVLTGLASYEVVSGAVNFDASGGSTQSLELWVYNVTGNYWIQPAGYRGINQNSGPGKLTWTFQTDSLPANNIYRIAILTAQTAATAYTINFDDFVLSPQTAPIGFAGTDWISSACTSTWVTNTTTTCKYKKLGDTAIISFNVALSGAPNAANLAFSMPTGLAIDLTKFTGNATSFALDGVINANRGTTGIGLVPLYQGGATPILAAYGQAVPANTQGTVNATTPQTWVSGDNITITITVPIVGWSSNVQMSSDTDTRVISFSGIQVSQVVTGGVTDIAFTTVNDRSGSWNGTQFKVPIAGDYVACGSGIIAAANPALYVFLNGSPYNGNSYWSVCTSTAGVSSGSTLITGLKSGDLISLRANNNTTVTGANLGIFRLSGPSVIAATESVNARYFGIPTGTIASAFAGSTSAAFPTKSYDSHNAWASGTTYTAPVSGKYGFKGQIVVTATYALNNYLTVCLAVNGAEVSEQTIFSGGAQGALYCPFVDEYNLNAGDVVTFRVICNGTTPTFAGGPLPNHMAIARIGN